MPFAVVIHEKGGQPRRQEFDKNEVTIGRVQGNDIVLPKQNVSKKHSRIVVKDGKFIIVDLKSTNGTYVNGRKIASPMVIKETDKIYIGDFILSTEGTGASTGVPEPASAEPAAEPELPKVEPPRKAPAPPAPAKLVPSPPKPVAAPSKASPPSGAATAVSYGSPPAAAPSPKRDSDTVPPVARSRPAAPVESDKPQGPLDALIQYADNEGIVLPDTWTLESQIDEEVINRLTKQAESLETTGVSAPVLVAELTGVGAIQPMLGDNAVTVIYVDGPNQITVESGETTQRIDDGFSSAAAVSIAARRLIVGAGGVWNDGDASSAQGNGLSVSFVIHGSTPHLTVERTSDDVTPIETLVTDNVLTDPMAEFLLTALALNRRIVLSANKPQAARVLCEALVEASWQNDRVVLIDAAHQLTGLSDFPRLDQTNNMETLCRHASMLRATHVVATGLNGTQLPPVLSVIGSISGGAVLTTRGHSANGSFENLSGGLALSLSGQSQAAREHLQSTIDVVVQISVDGKGDTKVVEIIDTNGRQEVLFSADTSDPVDAGAPAWFEQAIRDGYEVNQDLFG